MEDMLAGCFLFLRKCEPMDEGETEKERNKKLVLTPCKCVDEINLTVYKSGP